MKTPKALIIRGPGTNCDIETANAFKQAGAAPESAHINAVIRGAVKLGDYSILAFPGGFSYGDYIAAGKIFSVQLRKILAEVSGFIESGRPVIGICNGFQIMVKAGLLPFGGAQCASFTFNDCGHFVSKWVSLRINKASPCLFTKGLPETIELPIAHGEGKFVAASPAVLGKIKESGCIALQYDGNPNGSALDIAGLTNPRGNCLAIMPHPERYVVPFQHYARRGGAYAAGLQMFENAVKYVK
jgi:phosphoribosylformylglycinamidine synthase